MTLLELYNIGKKELANSKIDSAYFDAMCIFEHCFSISRHDLLMRPNDNVNDKDRGQYLELIRRRATHEPLQYIIGEWEFMGFKFKVGPGVLIPREDTQTLVQEAVSRVAGISKVNVVDLCAGSGAVSVSIASLISESEIVSVELYDDAIKYLSANVLESKFKNIHIVKDDVLNPREIYDKKFDMLVSNPPYIKSCDISALQEEVKMEPVSALDGGDDGLMFYRSIAQNWFSKLADGGVVALEIGINQEDDVADILSEHGVTNIKIKKDLNNINRVVSGIYRY